MGEVRASGAERSQNPVASSQEGVTKPRWRRHICPWFRRFWLLDSGFWLLILELEYLKPIVPRVHRDDAAVLVHRDAPRVGELAGVAAGVSPGPQAAAGLFVHELDAVVAELADDQPPVGV